MTTEVLPNNQVKSDRKQEDIIMLNDCKDYLLKELHLDELKEFIEELQSEIHIRNSTERRYIQYTNYKTILLNKFQDECLKGSEEIKKKFDDSINQLRRQQIRQPDDNNIFDDVEDDESEESEESEPKKPAKVIAKSKTNVKPKPKPKGRPKKS